MGRDPLGVELGRGGAVLVDHHGPSRPRRQRRLERGRVGRAGSQQAVGIELRAVDRVRVDAREVQLAGHHVGPERAPADFLARRPDRDQVTGVGRAQRGGELPGPGPGVVVRRVAEEPASGARRRDPRPAAPGRRASASRACAAWSAWSARIPGSACGWRPARHGTSQYASPTSPPVNRVGWSRMPSRRACPSTRSSTWRCASSKAPASGSIASQSRSIRAASRPSAAMSVKARSNASGPTRQGQSGPAGGTTWAPTGSVARPSTRR